MLNIKSMGVVVLLFLLTGCGLGLDVSKLYPSFEYCLFDYPSNTFICKVGKEAEYSLSIEQGTYLSCISATNATELFKSCNKGDYINNFPLCRVKRNQFECKNDKDERWSVGFYSANQFFCMGENSREKLARQCKDSSRVIKFEE